MVLEEAATPSSDAFAENQFSSDNDPYSPYQPTGTSITYRFDINKLPRPVPVIGTLLGFTPESRLRNINAHLKTAENLIKRPLTEEEASALAYHRATADRTFSWGALIGIAGGAYRCYSTANIYRFPFYTPKPEQLNPDSFFGLRGQQARVAIHSLRASSFISLGILFGGFFGFNQGMAAAAAYVNRDPRLKDFTKSVVNAMAERQGRPLGHPRGTKSNQGKIPTQEQPSQSDRSTRESWETSNGSYDDMSPTAGTEAYGDTREAYSDSQSQVYREPKQVPPHQSQRERDASFPMVQTAQKSNYDENSPTGGLGPMETASGTSTWERIRRQSLSGQPQAQATRRGPSNSTQTEQRETSSLGDSFAFSSTDEERQLAKSEAQREFDDRVDRERRGLDFEEKKKW